MEIQEKMVWRGEKMVGYIETESLAEHPAGATE